MADIRLKDLPQEAQDKLRDLDHSSAALLAIDAMHARNAAKAANYSADPLEAMREASRVRNAKVTVEIDDPVGLTLDTLEIAIAALHRKSFDTYDASNLARVLETAEAVLRVYVDNKDEADDRVRAILFPQK